MRPKGQPMVCVTWPLSVLLGLHLPQFLHAEAEFLRLPAFRQLEAADDFLGQRTAHAFRDEHVLPNQLHARLVIRLVAAILGDAHDARDHSAHRTIFPVQNFRTGKARIDFNTQPFRLRRQPTADIAERDGIVAMVAHQRRHEEVGHAQRAARTQHVEAVVSHFSVKRCALLLPVGDQLIERNRINNRA